MTDQNKESVLCRDFGNIRVELVCPSGDVAQVQQMLAEIPEGTDGYTALSKLIQEPVTQGSASDLTRTPPRSTASPWVSSRHIG